MIDKTLKKLKFDTIKDAKEYLFNEGIKKVSIKFSKDEKKILLKSFKGDKIYHPRYGFQTLDEFKRDNKKISKDFFLSKNEYKILDKLYNKGYIEMYESSYDQEGIVVIGVGFNFPKDVFNDLIITNDEELFNIEDTNKGDILTDSRNFYEVIKEGKEKEQQNGTNIIKIGEHVILRRHYETLEKIANLQIEETKTLPIGEQTSLRTLRKEDVINEIGEKMFDELLQNDLLHLQKNLIRTEYNKKEEEIYVEIKYIKKHFIEKYIEKINDINT